jgi:hypothetical protein
MSLDGRAKPRAAQLRADEAMTATGSISAERVVEFIREQINAGAEISSGN